MWVGLVGVNAIRITKKITRTGMLWIMYQSPEKRSMAIGVTVGRRAVLSAARIFALNRVNSAVIKPLRMCQWEQC